MSERVKIAVVGLVFGQCVAKELLEKDGAKYFDLAAVCDLNREQADRIAKVNNVPAVYDMNDLLADKSLKAIALMTPPVGRAGLIRKILASGKHVMTTKPFERDVEAARSVLAEAKRQKLAVHLNSPAVVPAPEYMQIQKWINEKNLGRPIGARAELWAHKPRPADGTWYDDPVKCPVAPIYRIGIYVINHLVSLFGQAEHATVLQSRLLTGRPTSDNAQMGLLFKNGAVGNVFVSFCVDDGLDHHEAITLNYEHGTIYWNVGPSGEKDPLTASELKLVTRSGKHWEPHIERVVIRLDKNYAWEAFYKAVLGNDPAPTNYADRVLGGLQIIDAMARAGESGKTEEVYKV